MTVLNISTIDSTRVLELNRPDKRNALNDELIGSLKAALHAADGEAALRSIIIKGAGNDFCSGADLEALRKISENTLDENVADAMNLAELFELIRKVRIPVIAAVHGRALAGGCGLATACDLIIATGTAVFGYPEVKIGFVPAMVTAILRRNLSEKRCFELLTQGFEFSAERAFELGFVNRIVRDDDLEDEAKEFAAVYSRVSRSAVEMAKRLLYDIDTEDFSSALRRGAHVNAEARMTEDCKKGIARFLEK